MNVFKKNDLVRPTAVVGAGGLGKLVKKRDLGQVLRTSTLDYGQGRALQKVQVLWLTGECVGVTSILNCRDLAHAS
jgi:hypothetical protein